MRCSSGRLLLALLVLATAVAIAGCWNPFRPEVSTERIVQSTGAAPQPTSSRNVMKLFKWCWDNQNITEYEKVFTDDFKFAFAESDSQGNQFPGRVLIREEEIESARFLFVGGRSGEPPANSISLQYVSPLIPDRDTRPGKEPPFNVMFQTDVDITLRMDSGTIRVHSKAVFFAVIWGAADIDDVVAALHIPVNERRWFIERYEELGPATVIYQPTDQLGTRRPTTWDRVLRANPETAVEHESGDGWRAGSASRTRNVSATRTNALAELLELDVTWGWTKAKALRDGTLHGLASSESREQN